MSRMLFKCSAGLKTLVYNSTVIRINHLYLKPSDVFSKISTTTSASKFGYYACDGNSNAAEAVFIHK